MVCIDGTGLSVDEIVKSLETLHHRWCFPFNVTIVAFCTSESAESLLSGVGLDCGFSMFVKVLMYRC